MQKSQKTNKFLRFEDLLPKTSSYSLNDHDVIMATVGFIKSIGRLSFHMSGSGKKKKFKAHVIKLFGTATTAI